MTSNLVNITYTLKFETSFHCGSGLPEGLIDRAVIKDKEGYLYIPGSTIKGVLRFNCERIASLFDELKIRDPHDDKSALDTYFEEPDIVETIFGSKRYEGTLFFDNAYMEKNPTNPDYIGKSFFNEKHHDKKYLFLQTETRTQTSISRRTGLVKEHHLFTSNFGIPNIAFEGHIHGIIKGKPNNFIDNLEEIPFSLILLIAGLSFTDRIGANRSTGMGRCCFHLKDIKINDQPVDIKTIFENIEILTLYED